MSICSGAPLRRVNPACPPGTDSSAARSYSVCRRRMTSFWPCGISHRSRRRPSSRGSSPGFIASMQFQRVNSEGNVPCAMQQVRSRQYPRCMCSGALRKAYAFHPSTPTPVSILMRVSAARNRSNVHRASTHAAPLPPSSVSIAGGVGHSCCSAGGWGPTESMSSRAVSLKPVRRALMRAHCWDTSTRTAGPYATMSGTKHSPPVST